MKSPFPYLGGKSKLASQIVSMFPADHETYCEPFAGAAWVFFAKEPGRCEILNDIDGELVTFFRVVQNHLEEFLRYFKMAVVSREIFELEKLKDPRTLTDIQRATRFYYLQKLCFGGKPAGRIFGTATSARPGLSLSDLESRLLEVHWRFKSVTIEHLDALACIDVYDRPGTLFYIDPPYWQTVGYTRPWTEVDFERLAARLDTLQGRFIMSLNDVPEVRRMFRAWTQVKVSTWYSVEAGGGRDKARSELLIHNLGRRPARFLQRENNNGGRRKKPSQTVAISGVRA